ncbi:major facilitator superfamily domain-containing protein [Gongronella butleri]|nr:major facilitator superfamily domain-containing protein [Gongronella butleri]
MVKGQRAATPPVVDEESHLLFDTASGSSRDYLAVQKEHELKVAKILNGINIYVVFSAIWIGVGLGSIDGSIVTNVLPTIGTEFHKSNVAVWVVTVYILSFASLQPLYGRISDIFGRKTTYMVTLILFFIGSLLCGIATNMLTLIIGRAIAGIGGGGLGIMNSIITSDLIPLRDRGKYTGYANIFYTVGALVGAPIGGLITDAVGWRVCFMMNIPLLMVPLYICARYMTDYNLEKSENDNGASYPTLAQQVKKIDIVGALLNTLSILCIMTACSFVGNTHTWTDPLVYTILIGAFVVFAVFVYVEKTYVPLPMVPWSIITNRSILAAALSAGFAMLHNFSNTLMLPIYFQAVLNMSSAMCGLLVIPRLIGGTSGILLGGFYMSRTAEFKRYMVVNGLVFIAVLVHMCTWTKDTPVWLSVSVSVLEGISSMSVVSSALIAMLAYASEEEMATTTSLSYLFRTTGGITGVAVSQALFQDTVKTRLQAAITDPELEWVIDVARKTMMEVRDRVPPAVLPTVIDAYMAAIHNAMIMGLVAAITAFVCVLCIRHRSLSR